MDPDSEYGSWPNVNADPTGFGSETLLLNVLIPGEIDSLVYFSLASFLITNLDRLPGGEYTGKSQPPGSEYTGESIMSTNTFLKFEILSWHV
jgi:hypothetical protein